MRQYRLHALAINADIDIVGNHPIRLLVIGQDRGDARAGAFDLGHPVQRISAAERGERAGPSGKCPGLREIAGEQPVDGLAVFRIIRA